MSRIAGWNHIVNERKRQVESEGWTADHDDEQGVEMLLLGALSYRDAAGENTPPPSCWPWETAMWKPKSRRRNLERAGALYLAAAETAERAHDFRRRDEIKEHVASCAILLGSILPPEGN